MCLRICHDHRHVLRFDEAPLRFHYYTHMRRNLRLRDPPYCAQQAEPAVWGSILGRNGLLQRDARHGVLVQYEPGRSPSAQRRHCVVGL